MFAFIIAIQSKHWFRLMYNKFMGKKEKILWQVLSGSVDANISFSDLKFLLKSLGFSIRIKGDHHIYTRPGVEEILNLQPLGSKAKIYQVKQVRNVILKYRLGVLCE